ncbi:MAG TPA: tRNA (adenosine(37)-N6)-threonylcarbamoyltransferase complex ATPase subunit type 1 TsaE [Candidatus Krumholzibacteria bacterium]|nr:tRNA (adenosine(37)-N6)-threonylcarbamoyltransferase complex ATPase subunit type 1 TsaE [Candidatus Krumholzibacteria bacterium]
MLRTRVHTVRTHDAAGTEIFGFALGARIAQGLCVCVTGPLGAGKTVLVKGLCRGLGADGEVTSPTFILMESFTGRLPIVHLDLYRLEHEREIEDIGVYDLLRDDVVVIAEWGERSPALIDAADLEITIEPGEGSVRTIHVDATEELAQALEGLL